MAKSINSQKVIEAEANLQTAKMLESITKLKDSLENFDKKFYIGWDGDAEKKVDEMLAPFLAIKDVMIAVKLAQKNCDLKNNSKMVDDIVKGIKLKTQYEMKINELEVSLNVAQKNNDNLQNEINKIKSGFKELIDKIIDEKASKEIVESFMIKYNTDTLEKSVKFAVKETVKAMLEEKKVKCEIESMPF